VFRMAGQSCPLSLAWAPDKLLWPLSSLPLDSLGSMCPRGGALALLHFWWHSLALPNSHWTSQIPHQSHKSRASYGWKVGEARMSWSRGTRERPSLLRVLKKRQQGCEQGSLINDGWSIQVTDCPAAVQKNGHHGRQQEPPPRHTAKRECRPGGSRVVEGRREHMHTH
jgi:hypothetical protein